MKHTIEITSLAYGGDGIGRIDGQVCFVPFALPGDVLNVEITRKAKGVLWAKIVSIAEASPHRLPATDNEDVVRGTSHVETDHIGVCGGCQWLHFAYPAQAEWKQRLVREALARYAGIEVDLRWREDPDLRTGWRTRAELHGDGARLGFYAHGSHDIVESSCPLLHPKLAAAVARVREAGWRRDVVLTVNPEGDEILAFGRLPTPEARTAVTKWDGPNSESKRGHFAFDGVPIWNGCFSQASLLLNRLLRSTVFEGVAASGPVFDAYSGNGNLSLVYLATRTVFGMDISTPAVLGARARGGDYRTGDEPAMAEAIRQGTWGTIILDPPRVGAKELVPALAEARAEELVYVSCDPVALARDLRGLAAGGWRVDRATALDLFPNTAHIETVVRLTR